jgi:hypothetical protein
MRRQQVACKVGRRDTRVRGLRDGVWDAWQLLGEAGKQREPNHSSHLHCRSIRTPFFAASKQQQPTWSNIPARLAPEAT